MAVPRVEVVHQKSSHSRRVVLGSASVAVALVVLVAWLVGWRVAEEAPADVSDLVSQGQILLGVAQLAFAGVLAIITLFYAMRTSESVELFHAQALDNVSGQLSVLVDQLSRDVERTIALTLVIGAARPSRWRQHLGVGTTSYRRTLEIVLPQLGAAIGEGLSCLAALERRRPNATAPVNNVRGSLAALVEELGHPGAPVLAVAELRRDVDKLSRSLR